MSYLHINRGFMEFVNRETPALMRSFKPFSLSTLIDHRHQQIKFHSSDRKSTGNPELSEHHMWYSATTYGTLIDEQRSRIRRITWNMNLVVANNIDSTDHHLATLVRTSHPQQTPHI